MAAKEKGKIVSASPDSPTLEKLSTFSQQIRSALHCFSAVATRTNALWQRPVETAPAEEMEVATRTNALWQSCLQTSLQDTHKSQPARMRCGKELGNRQGAVHCAVATRANALWQSGLSCSSCLQAAVATRANALWQRSSHAWMLTTTAGRNPRECAVAKFPRLLAVKGSMESQPARMR